MILSRNNSQSLALVSTTRGGKVPTTSTPVNGPKQPPGDSRSHERPRLSRDSGPRGECDTILAGTPSLRSRTRRSPPVRIAASPRPPRRAYEGGGGYSASRPALTGHDPGQRGRRWYTVRHDPLPTEIGENHTAGPWAMVRSHVAGAPERVGQSSTRQPLLWPPRAAGLLSGGPRGSRREPSTTPALAGREGLSKASVHDAHGRAQAPSGDSAT